MPSNALGYLMGYGEPAFFLIVILHPSAKLASLHMESIVSPDEKAYVDYVPNP